MKEYVARAMQIVCLERDQLEKLQGIEKTLGYLATNWNIQGLFNLSTLKERFNFPAENELLAQHAVRIEKDLKEKGFLKTPEKYEETLDYKHSIDWNVFNRKDEIIWDYQGPGNRRKGGGLLNRLAGADAQ